MYNTPGDHVTRDVREGIAKLGDLRFQVLDSAGLETAATSGTILSRTAEMTGNVLSRSQFAIFLIDVRLITCLFISISLLFEKFIPYLQLISIVCTLLRQGFMPSHLFAFQVLKFFPSLSNVK